MVHGRVGAQEVSQAAFEDAEVQRLATGMIFAEDEAYNAAFPAHRFAHVTLVLRDGTRLTSERTEAPGDPESPLSAAVIGDKFHGLADGIIGPQRARYAVDIISDLDGKASSMADLNRILYLP
jgi:2-methylcitrate dehydratase PrpD